MYRILAIFSAIIAILMANGCARVNLGAKDQEIILDHAGGYVSPERFIRLEESQLALEKLKQTPVMTSPNPSVKGFKGLIANLGYGIITTKINGPEKRTYVLSPHQQIVDYLIPGEYVATSYRGSSILGCWKFTVSSNINYFMNEPYHWFTYFSPY